jgi:hypothetical protein
LIPLYPLSAAPKKRFTMRLQNMTTLTIRIRLLLHAFAADREGRAAHRRRGPGGLQCR